MKCPVHNELMKVTQTRFGPRHDCPRSDCDIACFDGSTPADYVTRQARRVAHSVFDPLWRQGHYKWKRQKLYKKLAKYLDLPKGKCHIGSFDYETCQKVIKFVKELKEKQ